MSILMGRNAVGGEARYRKIQNYTDQHGRPWWAYIDIRTGEPTGVTMPHSWQAPWFPEEKYIRRVPGQQDKIEILYDPWIKDNQEALKEFKRMQIRAGSALHGQAYKLEDGMTPAMIEKIGMPPIPSGYILAMKQGNRYALGFTTVVDPRLKEFMPEEPALEEVDYSDYTPAEQSGEIEKPKRKKTYKEAVA